jgi:hypothetical protein
MPITQILLTAATVSQPPPAAYAGYGASPGEGTGTDITIEVENWNGSRIYWSVVGKGSPAADPNTDMTGTLSGYWDPGSGNANSGAVTTVNFVADTTTEGTEYWGVNLGSAPGASDYWNGTAWSIVDASLTPTYTLTPAANDVNEGSELTFTVGGSNIANGTYYWTIQTNAGDFATADGTVVVTSNSGTFGVTPTADTTTEGSETFTVALRSVSITGTILQTSSSITINDTSLTPEPIYTLTPDADNVDEGSSLTFTVGGSNITNGTYYWTIETGAGEFATADGTVSVTDNSGTFSVTPTEDVTTEGEQTFTVALRSVSITGTVLQTSESITINDTSLDPEPIYTLTPAANDVNEGSSLTVTVGGSNIANGTYYWTIETGAGEFATTSGTVSVTDNSGTFSVTPTADVTTEGSETFTVALRSVSITGTILETSESITINDTSLDLVPPFSLEFTGEPGTRRLAIGGNQGDWNLNDTWTIEFWSKTNSIVSNAPQTIMSQGDSSSSIDLYYAGGALSMSNGITLGTEPPRGTKPNSFSNYIGGGGWNQSYSALSTTGGTGNGLTVNVANGVGGYIDIDSITINTAGSGYTNGDVITITNNLELSGTFTVSVSDPVWTHVAISSNDGLVKVYYNGIQQSSVQRNLALTDSTRDLYIGRRGNNNLQYFNGELALIRISDTARYATAFSPSVSYGVDADTLLFLGTNNPLADLSTYQLNGVTTFASNSGALYISKSLYPDLDKQIQVGNTVVNADTSASATVTAAVYTADLNNWGVDFSPSMGNVLTANFSGARHTVTNTGVVRTNDVPSFQSLVFNQPQGDYLSTPASAAWNLGNNWTMEFWISANYASNAGVNIPGGQWGLLNQGGWYYGMPNDNCILVGLAGGNLTINQSSTNDIQFVEPAPSGRASGVSTTLSDTQWWDYNYGTGLATTGGTGRGLTVNIADGGNGYGNITINNPGSGYTNGDTITVTNGPNGEAPIASVLTFTISVAYPVEWTHVAIVNNGGGSAQKVYYNGVEQTKVSGSYTSNGKTSTTPLYIGRLKPPGYNAHFDGKMALVRISNTAKYLAPFTHTTTYGVEADTVLFLGKVNALNDSSASGHTVTNYGVTTSTSFPKTLLGISHPYNGSARGLIICPAGDPRLAEFQAVPVGARITSSIAGFGTRTVSITQSDGSGGQLIIYDQSGLTGSSSTSEVFNFYWV